jgi:hypothetical protein
VCPTRFPYLDKYDFSDAVPTNEVIYNYLDNDWQTLLWMCSRDDPNGIFKRLPGACDLVDRHPTCYWELPIMLDTGTASYADAEKRMSHMNAHLNTKYFLYWGDMQTFLRDQ